MKNKDGNGMRQLVDEKLQPGTKFRRLVHE